MDRARRIGAWVSGAGHGALLLAAAIVVSLTVSSPVASIVALAVWFAAGGAFYSTGQAALTEAVPEFRSAAVSWNNAAMNLGVAVGTAALGMLAVHRPSFWVAASTLALAAAVIPAVALGRSRHRR